MTFDKRYVVVLGACMTQFLIIGLFIGYGLFFNAFEEEFGWSRTLLSACSSMAVLVMGVLAIAGGRLNDRYGPRVVLSVSGLLAGTGFAALTWVTEPWHLFLLFGVLFGVGMSTHDVVTLSTVARWFEKRRGLMTGVVKSGTAAGQVCMPPLAALLIVMLGWRDAVVVLGVMVALGLLIAASLMRLPPKPAPGGTVTPQDGMTFAEAKGTRLFWTLCMVQFLFFPTMMTVPVHIVVHGIDLGLAPGEAAWLLSMMGASSVAGRLIVGGFADRIGGRLAYLICFVPLMLSLLALWVIREPWLLFPVMALYGFGHGGCFTVVSPTVAEFFGLRAHGAIFGPILFFGTIGGAVGPILAGWLFDVTGHYDQAFATLMGMVLLASVLVMTLPRHGAPKAA